MFSGLMSPDLPDGLKSGDYIKAHDNLENLVGDTDVIAHLTVDAADEPGSLIFFCTVNARRNTVYARTKTGISSCVMQPGHLGKAVKSIPKNAKPIGFPCVASMIIHSKGSPEQETPLGAVERFFPTICNEVLLDAMQDCVEANWLSSVRRDFSAVLVERAERLSAKVNAQNWETLDALWDAYVREC